MLSAKINLNGIDISLSGDKEDIIYALRNTTLSSPIFNEKQIPTKSPINTDITITSQKKPSLYSKEDSIRMYNYLSTQGDYKIQQFEITRGGKTNPTQYTVCLVFDNAKQRYIHYNPKSEDRFIQTFSIKDVLASITNNEQGFSLLHSVANRIWEKIKIVDDLIKITSAGSGFTDYEPILRPASTILTKDQYNKLLDDSVPGKTKKPAAKPTAKTNIVKREGKRQGIVYFVPQVDVLELDASEMEAKKASGKKMERSVLGTAKKTKTAKTPQPVSAQYRVKGKFAKRPVQTTSI